MKSLSRVQLLATPWTAAHQAPPSMGPSRQEHWSGVPLPSPIHVSTLLQILFPFRLLKSIEQSFLCYTTIGPYWSSILNLAVCLC